MSEAEVKPNNLTEISSGSNEVQQDSDSNQSQGQPSDSTSQEATPEQPPQTSEPNTENRWQWSDGMYGDGDKPDWLQERYKSVADQAKAYSELEKKFGEFKGAPKDGYNLEELGIDSNDPLFKHFSQTFKDLNLSQQGFQRIVSEFSELQQNMAHEQMEQEFKKLGPNGQQQVKQVATWADNTFNKDVANTVKGWLLSKNDVEAVQAIIAAFPSNNPPTGQGNQANQVSYESKQEVINEKEANWTRYQEDVNYRNSVKKRLDAAVIREDRLKGR